MEKNPVVSLNNASFFYTGENQQPGAGVQNIDLEIDAGQVVVLTGESGCGKTTVTRMLNGLIPHYFEGKLSGGISVCRQDVWKQPLYETAKIMGSVFQNPRSQFFNVDTTSEITFGCENLGMEEGEIRRRLDRVTQEFQLENLLDRNIFMLSGGEKQKIACSGISIMEPEVFVLDEPSSNLDLSSIEELRKIIAFWKKQGKTIIISEHRLYYLKELADFFVYMSQGRIVKTYTAKEFAALTDEERSQMGLRSLDAGELLMEEESKCAKETMVGYVKDKIPDLSMEEVGKKTEEACIETARSEEKIDNSLDSMKERSESIWSSAGRKELDAAADHEKFTYFHLKDFTYAYKNQPPVLKIQDAQIPAQGITAIIGRNGAGKSTFSRALCGLLKKCGKLETPEGHTLNAKDRLKTCYMVMQDVNHQLFTESVLEEILISMEEENEEEANQIMEKLDLLPLKDRHPMSLSGGQKQRVAIACALASRQKILILDEPTSGLDLRHMQETAAVLKELAAENIAVYVVTHDPEFIRACCTTAVEIEAGEIKNIKTLK